MTTTICTIIFILCIISFAINKIPMWVSAMLAVLAMFLTGCADKSVALSGFTNTNVFLIGAMLILAAGLERTSYINRLCDWILRVCNGSFKKAYLGYLIVAIVLINFVNSVMVAYAVVAPLLGALCDRSNESRSKYMLPLAIVIMATMGILPLSGAVANTAMFNGMMETLGVTAFTMKPIDFLIARAPILIIAPLWAYIIGPKMCPQQPVTELSTMEAKNSSKKPLSKFQDVAGLVIFFVSLIAIILADPIGIDAWVVALLGSLLMIVFGVLKDKEAIKAVPWDLLLLVAATLSMGAALNKTGAAELIGDSLAGLLGGTRSSFVCNAVFFIVPFVLTQFMYNRSVTQIFATVAILTCASMGANPIGPVILSYAGATTAYLTPMGTPAAAMAMKDGGYDLKAMFKAGWLPALLLIVTYTIWVSITYPLF